HAIDTDTAWLRSIYVNPHGRLLATTSTSRFHPPGLSSLLRAREQGICATVWCDAPVRHTDHITPHAEGGPTSLDNGQGLCARCNHAKQAPGWRQKTTQLDGRHAVETVTPTGHTYVSVAPTPPAPARTGDTALAPSTNADGTAPDDSPGTGQAVRNVDTAHDRDTVVPRDGHASAIGDEHTSTTGVPGAGEAPTSTRDVTATPPWTPAVGLTGPAPGRVPRSRYSIGCHTTPAHGAIPYRPSPPPRQARPAHRPPGRAGARSRRPDLSWAHPT
ncbi:HNH endonuclease, partial [Promicromonospora kroppenstedtii]